MILKSEQHPRWIMELSAHLHQPVTLEKEFLARLKNATMSDTVSDVSRYELLNLESETLSTLINVFSAQEAEIAMRRNRKLISKKISQLNVMIELLELVIENYTNHCFEPIPDETLRVKWKDELLAHLNGTMEQDIEGYIYRNEVSALENELLTKVLLTSLKKFLEQVVEGASHRSIEMELEKNHRLRQSME